jgi:heptaprenyl diphosphate synthase
MKKFTVREITTLALMLSMIVVLSALEGMLPPLPFNMRFGLSNVVTMYAMFFAGMRPAFILAVLKSLFVFLMRGPVAGLMSASGGMLSLLAVALAAAMLPDASYLFISVVGAITHNMAQLAVASVIVSTNLMPALMPVLAAAGVPAGALTAALLRVVMPLFKTTSSPDARLPQT